MSDFIRFVSPFDRVLYMKGLGYAEGLSTGELGVLARAARERSFRRGQKLIDSSQPARHWYLLVEGKARMIYEGRPARRFVAPDAVGMLEWLCDESTDLDVVAETDLLTLEIGTDATLEIFEDHPVILQAVMRGFSARIHDHLLRYVDGSHRQIWEEDVVPGEGGMDLIERIVLFRRSPFFQEVSLETMAQFVTQLHERFHAAGATIWRDGDPAQSTNLILSGRIRCELADGKSFTAGPGYPLGNVENIARRRRWYTATCESDVRMFEAESELFFDMFEDQFDIGMRFLREQARNLKRHLQAEVALRAAV